MAREGSKTAAAIAVMTANVDKPMEEVLPLIAEATGHDLPHARNYYVWCVRKGVAPGIIPVRAGKAPKEKVAKAPKAPKTVKLSTVVKKATKAFVEKKATKAAALASVTKSPEEIERIKAANLARMKAVLGKVKQTVRKEDEEAPAFVETDPFAAPAFLTRDEVTALV